MSIKHKTKPCNGTGKAYNWDYDMKIAKVGDEIHWQSFGVTYDNWVKGQRDCILIGYKSEVIMIDHENKEYGVELFYGFDRIPFDDVHKIIRKT